MEIWFVLSQATYMFCNANKGFLFLQKDDLKKQQWIIYISEFISVVDSQVTGMVKQLEMLRG